MEITLVQKRWCRLLSRTKESRYGLWLWKKCYITDKRNASFGFNWKDLPFKFDPFITLGFFLGVLTKGSILFIKIIYTILIRVIKHSFITEVPKGCHNSFYDHLAVPAWGWPEMDICRKYADQPLDCRRSHAASWIIAISATLYWSCQMVVGPQDKLVLLTNDLYLLTITNSVVSRTPPGFMNVAGLK